MKSKKVAVSKESEITLQDAGIAQIDPSQRDQMIATAAYFRAEKRQFSPNDDMTDWLASEQEIDRHICSFSS